MNMNNMRKVFYFLMAMVLAAVALPASAATTGKQYSLDITLPGTVSGISLTVYTTLPVPQGGGSPVNVPASGGQVYATIVNQTPSGGNSAINSFTFAKPPGWKISAPVGPSGAALSIDPSTGNLKVNNIPSLLPKDQQGAHGITIGFTLTPDACVSGSITWIVTNPPPQYVTVYTGNFSSTTFAFVKDSTTGTTNTNQVTGITGGGGCSTVTFNSNGGSPVASQNVPNNTTATRPADPTKTGSTFAGWYSDAGLTTQFNFATPITANITLYAKWTINIYTVSFNSNGGSAVASQNVPYNTAATQPADPTKTGFTFAGWFSDAGLTAQFNFATAITANITLYAKWMQNTMTLGVPPSATLNTQFQVTVGFNPPGGAPVTLSSDNCTLTSDAGTANPDGSLTFNVTITKADSFQCNITATAAGGAYATAQATINPVYTGVLGCGVPPNNNKAGNLAINTNPPLAYIGPPDWGLERSLNNKDQNPCTIAVPFEFQFDPTTNTAAFIIPNALGQKVAVEYVLLWRAVLTVDANNIPTLHFPNVAWLKDGSGNFVFVPALPCVDDDVDLGLATSGDQPVMPIIPNIEPFITLGATYPGYAPGQVALMCIGQEGWTAIGRNDAGQELRQYWHKVIDYGDGGVHLP